jgi:hypothetical protein
MLIEGIMAIQRIIDNEGLPPPGGKRVPLGIALQPAPAKAKAVGITVGG